MKTFDELLDMTPEELEQYRVDMVESVITNAPANNQLKLRALQAKINGISSKSHWTPQQRLSTVQDMMQESFLRLRDALNGVINHRRDGNGE